MPAVTSWRLSVSRRGSWGNHPEDPECDSEKKAHRELENANLGLTACADLGDGELDRVLIVDDEDGQPGYDEE